MTSGNRNPRNHSKLWPIKDDYLLSQTTERGNFDKAAFQRSHEVPIIGIEGRPYTPVIEPMGD